MSTENNNFVFDGFNDDSFATSAAWDGEGGGPPEIPVGDHAFELVGLEIQPNKKGNGQNFVCTWEVCEGDFVGKQCKVWMVCAGENFKDGHRKRIAAVFRDALQMLADGKMKPNGAFAAADAIGRRMIATVSHEPSKVEKYDANTETTSVKEYVNVKLSCERPYEAAGESTGDQPQAAAPAQPASAKAPPPPAPAPQSSQRRPPPAPPTRTAGGRAS